MTVAVIVLAVALAFALTGLAIQYRRSGTKRPSSGPRSGTRRILFPYVSRALSPRALDAALRLAVAEDATLVPVVLIRVSLDLPIDAPLPSQAALCLPLQEAIEQRAAKFGVPVDARIERGRTYLHALRQAIEQEQFDRIVIAAAASGQRGFNPDDVAWVLDNAPGEIVVLRPSAGEQPRPPARRPRARVRLRGLRGRPPAPRAVSR